MLPVSEADWIEIAMSQFSKDQMIILQVRYFTFISHVMLQNLKLSNVTQMSFHFPMSLSSSNAPHASVGTFLEEKPPHVIHRRSSDWWRMDISV